MLVESTVSHTSVEDAQDALAGLKNLPGFVFGYVVPGNPKTRLVFLCHCADGDVVRGQKVVDGHATKEGAHLETLRSNSAQNTLAGPGEKLTKTTLAAYRNKGSKAD